MGWVQNAIGERFTEAIALAMDEGAINSNLAVQCGVLRDDLKTLCYEVQPCFPRVLVSHLVSHLVSSCRKVLYRPPPAVWASEANRRRLLLAASDGDAGQPRVHAALEAVAQQVGVRHEDTR